jgi:hypothetical protein
MRWRPDGVSCGRRRSGALSSPECRACPEGTAFRATGREERHVERLTLTVEN